MGFLSGSATFERFWITNDPTPPLGTEHLDILEQHAISRLNTVALEEPNVGFLAGDHLLDVDFDLEKNVINEAMHFAIRIDTDQIPAAVRKAWMQMELLPLAAENPSGRPTKAQRQEAKEAVEAMCADEAASGKFRRMAQLPVLWDARNAMLYVGGSSPTSVELCVELLERAFGIELDRVTSGKLATSFAADAGMRRALDSVAPAVFHADDPTTDVAWWNGEPSNFDFLGNEFLLWLWWQWETRSDTIGLSDNSSVAGMFARTLSLECPRGESGKETISSESPVKLPEAGLAIRSGKLPRKAGFTLVRDGRQYDLTLQAESFAVGGARIQLGEDAGSDGDVREERIDCVHTLSETIDLLFAAFCQQRIGNAWKAELQQMRRWLKS